MNRSIDEREAALIARIWWGYRQPDRPLERLAWRLMRARARADGGGTIRRCREPKLLLRLIEADAIGRWHAGLPVSFDRYAKLRRDLGDTPGLTAAICVHVRAEILRRTGGAKPNGRTDEVIADEVAGELAERFPQWARHFEVIAPSEVVAPTDCEYEIPPIKPPWRRFTARSVVIALLVLALVTLVAGWVGNHAYNDHIITQRERMFREALVNELEKACSEQGIKVRRITPEEMARLRERRP